MTIYTRFGTPVVFKTAKQIPVWIERRAGEILWHYLEPQRTKRTQEVDRIEHWHVTAEDANTGKMLCDGQLMDSNRFVADNGIAEIFDACEAVRVS